MSRKTNYFKLGMFVIIAIALLLAGVFFLGARQLFLEEWLAETYFDHSVQGLAVGAPVKMMGVPIGTVKQIHFVDEEYKTKLDYVYVLFSINPAGHKGGRIRMSREEQRAAAKEMAKKGLRLTLSMQGLTGSAFLDAGYHDPTRLAELPIEWEPANAYVPSLPGTLARLGSSLEKTLDNLSRVDFAAMGEKLDLSLASLTDTLEDELKPLLADLRKESEPTLTNLGKAAAQAPELTARLNLTLQHLSDWINGQKGSLAEVVEDLRITSENLRQLTEAARRDPSYVLFGKPPPTSEVVK